MKVNLILTTTVATTLLILGLATAVHAGAEHYQFQLLVDDYNDCTEEMVSWDALVRETINFNQTPSGKALFVSHWLWEGTVTGHDSGYEWYSKGASPYVERWSTNGDLVGGFMLIENSVLKPLTPGAPRIKLDVHIRTSFNAHGELVVDQFTYTYHCL